MKITVVEDTKSIRDELKILLERYGYNVETPIDFENIIEEILKIESDLILLDINLPYFDGYYICREIRKKSNVPIIVVTSRDSDMDELMSINIGADDFVTKPYNTQILLARIEALLRRSKKTEDKSDILKYKNIELDLSKGTAKVCEEVIELTKNELKILGYLIKNKGKIVKRDELMEYLWDSNYFVDDNTLSVNVTRIRKKLSECGDTGSIETKRGLGYIMP